MLVATIIIGVVISIIGGVLGIVFGSEKNIIGLGVFAVVFTVGVLVTVHGTYGYMGHYKAKHEAILRDLRAQGFKVESDDVYAIDGHYLSHTTEADLEVGGCLVPFIARHVDGVWRVALPTRTGVHVLTVADIAGICR